MDVKPAAILILLATLLCLAGCDMIAGTPGIQGTWEADDRPGYTLDFRSDGTVVLTRDGEDITTVDYAVSFQFDDPLRVDEVSGINLITLTIDGEAGTVVFADQDHITITDPDGDAISFHRLK